MEQLNGLTINHLYHLAPELTLIIAAVVMTLVDLFLPNKTSRHTLGGLALLAFAVSAFFLIVRLGVDEPISILNGSYRVDDFGNLLKLVFLVASALIVTMSLGSMKEEEPHVGEYYSLMLAALVGAMVMTSTADLITMFVGLELLSITSYILVGLRKKNLQSNEGAFKYLVLGGISSATLLYGMSFLYGTTGSTNLGMIRQGLIENGSSFPALIYLAFFLIVAGIGFKIAAAPFHTWAPDVYQGAPTPVTAFLAVVSKAAAFAMLFRFIYDVFFNVALSDKYSFRDDIFFTLSILAVTAMVIGNVLALRQNNVKRLFAYSGVANAGYLLIPIALQFSLVHYINFSEFYYYLIAYLFMNIGAFAVVMMLERSTGSTELHQFAGLYHRAPRTAIGMTLIILSLAGLPITAGFFGKFFILFGAIQSKQYALGAILIGTSVLGFYYYFRIIRQMFMRADADSKVVQGTIGQHITLWICAVSGVLIGLFPQWILEYVNKVFSIAVDLFT